ncbi:Cof-type HAD-IIB family hydrolase [Staphylococcus succinus]|uniref:Cof-type HAD-IIB family hydrolase n=1 Tax=Staphylococcus succinus TaxID=61015 RepID=UPI000A6039F4|nr:Cof-type HAD-IIB family hydrolase [Staphylococcus succinus]MBU0437165.1 Cof-type HAD-IIB family hydrolase [Staphylococcus succinus]MEB7461933.1 Cof-type HAD-IIB family hydrolase [Staphylococcus succinus]PKI22739.1 Cof-type HAD-IIB family hydrolase [Staphylococcus succinus]PTI48388.1 HAD family phosphatase [Staphylococcus succinus]PTJ82896.1 HAD family phosphatase [Staphylococcus succinus]
MKPYLICLDLDGTLLNDEKVIPTYTKQVLKTLQSQGHKLMIATGRPYRASQIYYHELHMDTPVVNFNGAYVHHPKDNNFKTKHDVLDLELSKEIIQSLNDYGVSNIIAEIKDHVFLNNFDQKLFDGFSMGTPKVETGDLLTSLTASPTSILVEAEEVMIPRVKQMLTHFYAENIEHRRWGSPFPVIEIVKQGISKARGIDYVKSHLDIDRNQIIAFGDEDNDLEMIKYAKYGIAMENGLDELKHVANETTYSNNDDGIGRYLNNYFQLGIPYEASITSRI